MGVALAVAIVEDQPRRHGLGGLVAGVHRLADLHVGVRLVDEPVAGGVDDDRARPLPGLVEGRLTEAAGARVREPPRLVHQVGRRAEPNRREQRLAGVARVGDRPLAPCSAGRRCTPRASRGCGRSRPRRSARRAGPARPRACRRAPCEPRRPGRPRPRVRRAAPRSTPGCLDRARRAASGRSATRRSSAAPADAPWRRRCGSRPGRRRRSSARCGCSATATATRWSSPTDRRSGRARLQRFRQSPSTLAFHGYGLDRPADVLAARAGSSSSRCSRRSGRSARRSAPGTRPSPVPRSGTRRVAPSTRPGRRRRRPTRSASSPRRRSPRSRRAASPGCSGSTRSRRTCRSSRRSAPASRAPAHWLHRRPRRARRSCRHHRTRRSRSRTPRPIRAVRVDRSGQVVRVVRAAALVSPSVMCSPSFPRGLLPTRSICLDAR